VAEETTKITENSDNLEMEDYGETKNLAGKDKGKLMPEAAEDSI